MTAGTTGDLKYRQVELWRPLEKSEITGDCRDQ